MTTAGGGEVREAARIQDLKELIRHVDEDRDLLMAALRDLQPGMSPVQLGAALFGLCHRPLGLASFYLALADWERDVLAFPFYYEGGRDRPRQSRSLSSAPGLTGETLKLGRPLYLKSLEEGRARGVVLSQAEIDSGLAPHSWHGVPLGATWCEKPFGLVSFQSFQPDAFTASRLRLMEALGEVLAFALKARPIHPEGDPG
ncbi:MAG: GAF domain-containing protein [Acidobacteria bacterium]|nr:GAF domain-containing protein [Acidobacteriota bacterium]